VTDDDNDDDVRYQHYVAAGHVEGKAAIQIRLAGSTGGTMHHNNPNGTCPYCLHQVPTLLPQGATLTVIPPPGATAPSPWWTAEPITFVGNDRQPTPPSPERPT
jgi:Double-stranded DNA deaminase toxin A